MLYHQLHTRGVEHSAVVEQFTLLLQLIEAVFESYHMPLTDVPMLIPYTSSTGLTHTFAYNECLMLLKEGRAYVAVGEEEIHLSALLPEAAFSHISRIPVSVTQLTRPAV